MTQLSFDDLFTTPAEAKQKGLAAAKAAADHADRVVANWTEDALALLHDRILALDPGQEFIVEELRLKITEDELPLPTDKRAWGQVTQMALRRGLMVATGHFRSAVSSNASPKPCYRAA